MLLAHFVFEAYLAIVAGEVWAVQWLHHEAIHCLAEVKSVPAVRAGVVSILPLADAYCTAELIALLALFWIFYDLYTDATGKVLVEWGFGLLRSQMLFINLWTKRLLELCNLLRVWSVIPWLGPWVCFDHLLKSFNQKYLCCRLDTWSNK